MTSKPTLVLLHAFPLDSRMWTELTPLLAAHADVLTIDQPGFGSQSLGEQEPHDFSSVIDRIAGVDADELVLAGCSMGGYATMQALHTVTPAAVIFMDTKASADSEGARAGREDLAGRAETEPLADWLADFMVDSLLGTTTRNSNQSLVDKVTAMIGEQDARAVAWAARTLAARADSVEFLQGLSLPSKVIVGEEDVITSPDLAEELAEVVGAGAPEVIDEAGHLTPLEAPDKVAAAIIEFLAETFG